jgi:hypothetical protein
VAYDPRHIALVCVDQPNGGRVEFSVGFAGSTPVLAIREFYPDGHRRGAVSTMVRGLDAWLEALLTLRGEAVAALGEGATRPVTAQPWGTWCPDGLGRHAAVVAHGQVNVTDRTEPPPTGLQRAPEPARCRPLPPQNHEGGGGTGNGSAP